MSSTPSSPWLAQLKAERPHFRLEKDMDCDVTVVGAGIAGVSTAYQLLRHTNATILLIDAGRIAHGATGRNAGQVVSAFERPLTDLVATYGLEKTADAHRCFDTAWEILHGIIDRCGLQTPLQECQGHIGFTTIEQIILHLEENEIRLKAGLPVEPVVFKTDPALLREIPEHLRTTLVHAPHSLVLKMLETEDPSFIAASIDKRGCMNSALFCEELVAWMVNAYGGRVSVAEHLPVRTIELHDDNAVLHTTGPDITTRRVVLCTNGFENFTIDNRAGQPVDTQFHLLVNAEVSYMSAYLEEPVNPAAAVSYMRNHVSAIDPYPYLTRRRYEHSTLEPRDLICIGGPERMLPDRAVYDTQMQFPSDIEEEIDRMMHALYRHGPQEPVSAFRWHGLTGYTPNLIRRIGFEPKNRVLLYNLGCNGIGILPSIYGGKRIAQLLSGMQLAPSLFDPQETFSAEEDQFAKEIRELRGTRSA